MLKDLAVFDINIFREQMMEDVDALEYILEEIYSGFESLNPEYTNSCVFRHS